jgi:hypothetical protein
VREDGRLAGEGRRREIGVHVASPGGQAQVLERLAAAGAGAVDQGVEAAELVGGVVDGPLESTDIGHVDADGAGRAQTSSSRLHRR